MSRVLVVSPHPDDEAIGCGGTLRKHAVEGHDVRVVFLTSGENGGHGCPREETMKIREQEAQHAAAILGLTDVEFWRLADGSLQATQPVIDRLRAKLEEWCPDFLYVPHDREMHPDHCAASQMVRHAVWGQPSFASAPAVRMFEVWTPLQQMDEVVDITPYVDAKLAAIQAHKSQCAVMRFDEASLALARYRAVLHSWHGVRYAEIFLKMHA